MSEKLRTGILKAASLLALCFLFSTVFTALRVIAFVCVTGTAGFFSGFIYVFAGFTAGGLMLRFAGSRNPEAAAYISAVIPVILTAFLYHESSQVRIIFEAAVAAAFYIVGVRACSTGYDSIFTYGKAAVGYISAITFMVIVYIIHRNEWISLKPVFLFFMCLSGILMLVLENQKNIDCMLKEKMGQTPMLPDNIHRHNFIFIITASAAVLFLVFFKPLTLTLWAFLKGIGVSINIVFSKLLNLIFSGHKSIEREIPEKAFKKIPPWVKIKNIDNLDEKIVLVILAIVSLIVIFFIIRKMPTVYEALKSSFKRLAGYLRTKFPRFAVRNMDKHYFGDETGYSKEAWLEDIGCEKQKSRAFKRKAPGTDDPVKLVRHLYARALDALLAYKVTITRSDTTGEISEKSNACLTAHEDLDEMTGIYDRVRYGDSIPETNELEKVKYNYSQIIDALKNKAEKK